VSAGLCGSAEEVDDLAVELEAVGVVSFALPFVSMGVKALLFESIPLAKATAVTKFV
jgi:hypothetical protein